MHRRPNRAANHLIVLLFCFFWSHRWRSFTARQSLQRYYCTSWARQGEKRKKMYYRILKNGSETKKNPLLWDFSLIESIIAEFCCVCLLLHRIVFQFFDQNYLRMTKLEKNTIATLYSFWKLFSPLWQGYPWCGTQSRYVSAFSFV